MTITLDLKKTIIVVAGLVILYAAYVGISLLTLPSVDSLKNRRMNMTIRVKDWKGHYHPLQIGPKNRYWTSLAAIPPEMKWAVILAEDENFYRHEGIDVKAIKNAIKHDLEKKRFERGASTITQQVAKNIFLSREKTITRKIKEIILARRMEQELTKGRILELYLNVVELGPMVYGVGHGARYYFGKPASALTPRECAFLAAMLPGPRVAYNPYRNMRKVVRRSDMILKLMRRKRVLSEAEYRFALAQEPNIAGLQRKVEESIQKEEVFENISSAVASEIPEEGEQQPAAPESTEIGVPDEKAAPPPEANTSPQEQPAPIQSPSAGGINDNLQR
ncbi:MAG TPA: biosynthetic peptidoglycan transglycosylase [Geobacteraceae bacterium]|nr:biosynthetic peptidoglycan transglycosylase [Geobacteraceae bacterium]